MTRSRPYKKDDNAHVEQKNWTHVRQCFGYERHDNPEVVAPINALVKGAYGPLLNFFHASLKLERKERNDGRAPQAHLRTGPDAPGAGLGQRGSECENQATTCSKRRLASIRLPSSKWLTAGLKEIAAIRAVACVTLQINCNQLPAAPPRAPSGLSSTAGGRELRLESRPPARFNSLSRHVKTYRSTEQKTKNNTAIG